MLSELWACGKHSQVTADQTSEEGHGGLRKTSSRMEAFHRLLGVCRDATKPGKTVDRVVCRKFVAVLPGEGSLGGRAEFSILRVLMTKWGTGLRPGTVQGEKEHLLERDPLAF